MKTKKTKEEKLQEKELKKLLKPHKQRPSKKYLKFKIAIYIVSVGCLCCSFFWQSAIEEFLNPAFYSNSQKQNVILDANFNEATNLKVHFIDVGCADATFIEFPNGKTALIDCAGDKLQTSRSISALSQYLQLEIFKHKQSKIIDYLVITHPDRDHYAGAQEILRTYEVKNIIRPAVLSKSEKIKYSNDNVENEIDTYAVKTDSNYDDMITSVYAEVEKSSATMHFTTNGLNFSEDGYIFEFLMSQMVTYDDWNDYSPFIKISYGGKTFALVGDASAQAEQALINKYNMTNALSADILKVAHHGSETSSSQSFLLEVSAKYYIISTREGIYSNIPSKETMDRITLQNPNSTIFRTDEIGNIIMEVDAESHLQIFSMVGAFKLVSNMVYINLYYVIILLAVILYFLIFKFRVPTHTERVEKMIKKSEKTKQKMLKEARKRSNKK